MSDFIPSADPIFAGQTRPAIPLKWMYDDNSPLDLTGATWAGKIQLQGTSGSTPLAGSFSVTSAGNGEMTYSWVTADVAVPGVHLVQITATIGGQTYIRQFYQPVLRAL